MTPLQPEPASSAPTLRVDRGGLEHARAVVDLVGGLHRECAPDELQRWLVVELERLIPGGAVALFQCDAAHGLVTRRAAGPRWRTKEFERPGGSGIQGAALARLVRTQAPLVGEVAGTGDSATQLILLPVQVAGECWGALVVLRPAASARLDEDVWATDTCATHLGAALTREFPVRVAGGHRSEFDQRVEGAAVAAAHVAHALGTYMTTVVVTAQLALAAGRTSDEEGRTDLETIHRTGLEVAAFGRTLQAFAQAGSAEDLRLCDLTEPVLVAVEHLRTDLQQSGRAAGTRVRVDIDSRAIPPVLASTWEMRHLVSELLHNAVEAMSGGGTVRVELRAERHGVRLSIQDDGPGVPDWLGTRAFEPFVGTKTGPGRGLGLTACWRIARAHGGTLVLRRVSSGGTLAVLHLPVAPQAGPTG